MKLPFALLDVYARGISNVDVGMRLRDNLSSRIRKNMGRVKSFGAQEKGEPTHNNQCTKMPTLPAQCIPLPETKLKASHEHD